MHWSWLAFWVGFAVANVAWLTPVEWRGGRKL
jgi:hypothetical protein